MNRRTLMLSLIGVALGVGAIMYTRKAAAAPTLSLQDETLWTDNFMSWIDNLTQDARDNESKYRRDIEAAENQYSIPQGLLGRLLYQESRYRSDIILGEKKSAVGALGIAQFMPATAAEVGIDPLNPVQAIYGAAKYLRRQFDSFGDWRLALAAYNAGPGNVRKYGGVPPFDETQKYVAEISSDVGLA